MSTTAEHIAARDDQDIRERLVATAEMMGIPNAAGWALANAAALVAVPVTVSGENTSITATYAYAAAVRDEYLADERALPPGKNPGAVTDPVLSAAVTAVYGGPTPEPEPVPVPIDIEDVPSS